MAEVVSARSDMADPLAFMLVIRSTERRLIWARPEILQISRTLHPPLTADQGPPLFGIGEAWPDHIPGYGNGTVMQHRSLA